MQQTGKVAERWIFGERRNGYLKFCFCDIISDNMMGNELSPTVKIFSHLSFNLKSSTFYEDKRALKYKYMKINKMTVTICKNL